MKKSTKLILIIPFILLAASCQQQASINSGQKITTSNQVFTASTTPTEIARTNIANNVNSTPTPKATNASNSQTHIYTGSHNYINVQSSGSSTYSSSSVITITTSTDTTIINNITTSNNSGSSNISINLTSSSFPEAKVGQAYSASAGFTQSGNQEIEVTYSGLPNGISTDGSGSSTIIISNPGSNPSLILSGTPTQAGSYNVTVTLDNKAGTVITQNFSLVVNP